MWPTHTDKPQTMQESRSWLVTGDDQDGYDARQSGRIHTREWVTWISRPHERVRYSSRQQRLLQK